jgi:peroxiredoxin
MKTIQLFLLLMGLLVGDFVINAQQLPSVLLKDGDGKTVNTSTLQNEGKPFIISFFATWCKPCLRELEAIHEVYADWQEETGVQLIVVSENEAQDAQKAIAALKAQDWNYQLLLDPNGEFKRALGVNLLPTVFIIDGNGKIAFSRTGYNAGSEEELIEKVRHLTKE